MSDWVTLSLRARPATSLDIEELTADRCAELSAAGIARLPVWQGNAPACVGDFFDVRGERSSRVRLEGALGMVNGLGAGNAGGEVHVHGAAGARLGAGMTGGQVIVHGDVGPDAGAAMSGGLLRVYGNVGDRLGAALPGASRGMTGGEIVVSGSAGSSAAACSRRGLVVVGGGVGTDAGRSMIAGTLVVLGAIGGVPGRANKRGSIVALASVRVPPTYAYACTFEPTYLRLLMTYLVRRHGLRIDPTAIAGKYHRYCGDAGGPGKGEILVRAAGSSDAARPVS